MIEFLRMVNIALHGKLGLLKEVIVQREEDDRGMPKTPEFANFLTRLGFAENFNLDVSDWMLLEEIMGSEYCDILQKYYNKIDND